MGPLLCNLPLLGEHRKKKNLPPPTSPLIAQQLQPEIYKEIEQLRAEISARDNLRTRLDSEVTNSVKEAKYPPRLSMNGEKLVRALKVKPAGKDEFVIQISTTVRFTVESIQRDIFDTFLVIQDMDKFMGRDRSISTQDRITAEAAQSLNRILWDYALLKEMSYLNGMINQPPSSTSSSFKLSKDDIDRIEYSLKPEPFEALKNSLIEAIKNESKKQDASATTLRNTLSSLRTRQAQLQDVIEQGQAQIDTKILKFGLPAFGIILLGILLVPKAYRDKELQTLIFSSGIVLDMFTVFLLTMSILLLGLSQRVHENVLGTLLGGISGYVLGRTLSRGPSAPPLQPLLPPPAIPPGPSPQRLP